jgi:hypothetical protein
VLGSEENIEYKFPTSDSDTEDDMKTPQGKKLFCKANFTDGEVRRCRMLMQDIESNIGGADVRKSRLTQKNNENKFDLTNKEVSNECSTDYRLCTEYKSMWIITHGMSADTNVKAKNHMDVGKAITSSYAQNQPLVLFYDWGDLSRDAGGNNPHNVDQHLGQSTSYKLAKRLKSWGMSDTSTLNLVGHSMGTMMINQLAYALQYNEKMTGEIDRMFYLDPPRWGNGKFQADANSEESKFIYTRYNGYNSKSIRARIQRSFVGLNDGLGVNGCGNDLLAKTANEVIGIRNKHDGHPCKIHGGVVFVFANLVKDFKNGMSFQINRVDSNNKMTSDSDIKVTLDLLNAKYLRSDTIGDYDAMIRNEGEVGKIKDVDDSEVQSKLSNDYLNYITIKR